MLFFVDFVGFVIFVMPLCTMGAMHDAPTVRARGGFVAEAVAHEPLCDEHYLLRLRLASFPPSRPGQFVQLRCGPEAQPPAEPQQRPWTPGRGPELSQPELTAAAPLLRRPFSLAGRGDTPAGVELDVIYRTVGMGTRLLTAAPVGARLSLLGPLGNGFTVLADRRAAAVIGGGVGIPPMLYLADALAAAGKTAVAFAGARSRALLPLHVTAEPPSDPAGPPAVCTAEFARSGTPTVIATDDGSAGFGGFVSDAFEHWLSSGAAAADDLAVYCCGPEALMRRVGEVCIARGIPCQLALERHMACGMGTCQSCIVRVRDENAPEDRGWSYKLCCSDGPVFNATDVLW